MLKILLIFQRLLDHLKHEGYRPSRIRVIAKDLRISSKDREVFDQVIQEALVEGIVEIKGITCFWNKG